MCGMKYRSIEGVSGGGRTPTDPGSRKDQGDYLFTARETHACGEKVEPVQDF